MHWSFVVFAFCFGVCLGSFANVCIWRLPRAGMSPFYPSRSLCPGCGFRLPWYDNLPVVSWFSLGGICRCCGGRISFRYTAVEILSGLLVVYLSVRFADASGVRLAELVFWTALLTALLIAAFIDLELLLLPDEILVPALGLLPWLFALFSLSGGMGPRADVLGGSILKQLRELLGAGLAVGTQGRAVGAALCGAAGGAAFVLYLKRRSKAEGRGAPVWSLAAFCLLGTAFGSLTGASVASGEALGCYPGEGLFLALSGCLSGAGIIWVIRNVGKYAFAQEAMGFGDIKLMAVLGTCAGVGGTLWTLALASVLGSVFGVLRYATTGDRQLPFGPFLIAGALIVLFGRQELGAFLKWYSSLLQPG